MQRQSMTPCKRCMKENFPDEALSGLPLGSCLLARLLAWQQLGLGRKAL